MDILRIRTKSWSLEVDDSEEDSDHKNEEILRKTEDSPSKNEEKHTWYLILRNNFALYCWIENFVQKRRHSNSWFIFTNFL